MWVAVGVVGGALVTSYFNDQSSDDLTDATEAATELEREMYYQSRADMEPWRTRGVESLDYLANYLDLKDEGGDRFGYDRYEQSPYYNFLQEQGQKSLENSASAGGSLGSGRQQKALMEYGQNLASTDYGNWLSREQQKLAPYQSLAGLGQSSATQMGQSAQNFGTSAANNALYAANINAQNTQNQGQIWGNALGQLAGMGNLYSLGY